MFKTTVKIVIGYLALHGAVDVAKRAHFGWTEGQAYRGASWQQIDNAYHASQIR